MYFFNDLPFYLLFKPRDGPTLAMAWLAIFALGMLYEAAQAIYGRAEAAWWVRYHVALHRSGDSIKQRRSSDSIMLEKPLLQESGGDHNDVEAGQAVGGNCCDTGNGTGTGNADPLESGQDPICDALVTLEGPTINGTLPFRASSAVLRPAAKYYSQQNKAASAAAQRDLLVMDIIRGIARLLLASLAYVLMLAVMSYHIGIFVAAVAGVGVGSAVFGRWRFATGYSEAYSHCGS
jgi:hypothetical protein